MSKKKATTVTVIFAVMLAGLDFCLWKVNLIAFVVLTGALALFGYWEAARVFSAWLSEKPEEPALDLPTVTSYTPVDQLPEDFSATVEEIMQEVQREKAI